MNDHEAGQIYEMVFIAWPGFRDWLNSTKTPAETLAEWRRMIVDLEVDHCIEAVRRMRTGDLELPAAYDRDRLPIKLRSYARRIAQDVAKEQADINTAAMSRQRLQRREADPFAFNLGTLLKQSREAGKQLQRGEITIEQNQAIVDELATKARQTKAAAVAAERVRGVL